MAICDLVDYCNHRWRIEHGIAENLLVAGKRHVSARLGCIEISSQFDSVRLTEALSLTIGHIARLRSTLPAVNPCRDQPQSESNDSAQIVSFDRLFRTLHLLNYLNRRQDDHAILFLEVEARHILSVPTGHGAYFAGGGIHRCGLTASEIVLSTSSLFAACPGEYLRRRADGMANYRDRGYRLAIAVNEVPLSKSLGNFLYDLAPDYIRLNAGHPGGAKKAMRAFLANHLARLQRLADAFELARASRIALVRGRYLKKRRKQNPRLNILSNFEKRSCLDHRVRYPASAFRWDLRSSISA